MLKAVLSALLAAAAAVPAAAQQPPPAEQDPIVIQGQKTDEARIDSFVDTLAKAPVGGQLARFEQPICPLAIGLPDALNGEVEERLRKLAAAVGADVAAPDCVANVLVLVARDKSETLDGLKRGFPHLLSGVPRERVARMAASPGPAAAWQVKDVVGSDGMPLSSGRMSPDGDPVRIVATVGSPSRIRKLTKPHFIGSVLVLEARALENVSTRQIADYAAMRTFADTGAGEPASLPAGSILGLFNAGVAPETAPQSVTWWDYAFLKSLYATSNAVTASLQRNQIRRLMAEELARAGASERQE